MVNPSPSPSPPSSPPVDASAEQTEEVRHLVSAHVDGLAPIRLGFGLIGTGTVHEEQVLLPQLRSTTGTDGMCLAVDRLCVCVIVQASMFLGIFLSLGVVIFGFLLVYLLRRYSVSWFPEAWAFFGLGLCIAGVSTIGLLPGLHVVVEQLRASFPNLFFVVLLPVIIFESGVSLDKQPFFANFGAILLYAFVGTFASALVVGVTMWALGAAGAMYGVRILDALTFGAIISAIDPVTVLAVFQELGVERRLYALIFGESVLNDAVAIVLLHSLLTFQTQDATLGSAGSAIVGFTVVFAGSLLIGVSVGVLGALLFKHVSLRARHRPIERVLFTVLPFIAYMLAEAMQLSGVVAILFTGITTSHYTARNVTPSTRRFSRILFRLFASVAEALVFVSIGVATPPILSRTIAASNASALWIALLAVALGRYANVRLCTAMANSARSPAAAIKAPAPFVLWFSGLRGGVAFALAASAKSAMTDQTWAEVQETACLFVVVVTMTSIGGTVGPVAHALGLSEKHKAPAPLEEGEAPEHAVPASAGLTAAANHYDVAAPPALVAVDGTRFQAGGREEGEAASSDGERARPKRWASRRTRGVKGVRQKKGPQALLGTLDDAAAPAAASDSASPAAAETSAGATFAGDDQGIAGSAAASEPGGPEEVEDEEALLDEALLEEVGSGQEVAGAQAEMAVEAAVTTARTVVTRALLQLTAVTAVLLRGLGLGLGTPAEVALGVRHTDGRLVTLWSASGMSDAARWCGLEERLAHCRCWAQRRGALAAHYTRVARTLEGASASDDDHTLTSHGRMDSHGSGGCEPPSRQAARGRGWVAGGTGSAPSPAGASNSEDTPEALPVAVSPRRVHDAHTGGSAGSAGGRSESPPARRSSHGSLLRAAGDGSADMPPLAEDPHAPPTGSRAGDGAATTPLTVGEALRMHESAAGPTVVQSLLQAAPSLQDLARFDSRVLTPLFTSTASRARGAGGAGGAAAEAQAAATDAGDTTAMEGEGASDAEERVQAEQSHD